MYGYISELLMDIWLETNAYKYTEVAWGQIGSKHLVKKLLVLLIENLVLVKTNAFLELL